MKIDVGKIALVAVMIAGIQTSALYHRINAAGYLQVQV